ASGTRASTPAASPPSGARKSRRAWQGPRGRLPGPLELKPQMLPDGRPLALDDAEHDRIAVAAVRGDLVVAQDRILLRAESRDRDARRMVEPVRAEFDR